MVNSVVVDALPNVDNISDEALILDRILFYIYFIIYQRLL